MADLGPDFVIEVEDYAAVAPKPFVPIEDLTTYDRSRSRNTTRTAVFHRATPRVTRSQRETTLTFSGLMNATDPGQQILRNAEEGDVQVTVRILPDGVNGYKQLMDVNTTTHRSGAEGFQETSFAFTAAADPVLVGTGPVGL